MKIVIGIFIGLILYVLFFLVFPSNAGIGFVCGICGKRHFSYRKYTKCCKAAKDTIEYRLKNAGACGSPNLSAEPEHHESPYPGGPHATPGMLQWPSDRR